MTEAHPSRHTATAGKGRFVRTPETAARDAQAAALRGKGMPFKEIAEELGFNNKGDAYRAVQRAFADIARGPVEELARSMLGQLEELAMSALEILERDHLAHSNGKLVKHDDGTPVYDDGPKLAAIAEVRKLNESIRRLTGADAAQKVNVSGGVRYEVVGVDPQDLT